MAMRLTKTGLTAPIRTFRDRQSQRPKKNPANTRTDGPQYHDGRQAYTTYPGQGTQ